RTGGRQRAHRPGEHPGRQAGGPGRGQQRRIGSAARRAAGARSRAGLSAALMVCHRGAGGYSAAHRRQDQRRDRRLRERARHHREIPRTGRRARGRPRRTPGQASEGRAGALRRRADGHPRNFQMTRKRLAVARLWFEGNAFGPVPAGMPQFEQYEWQAGPAVLDAMRGTATELGAVARFADTHPEWEVVVLRCAAALPAGPIDEAVMQRYTQEVRAGLQAGIAQGGWDAVYLSLHGAAITDQRETPELDIARMVRELLPSVPLGASFDLHGNMPPAWADVLDIASVYRTHPHIDMDEAADRVLDGLVRCATQGLRTRRVLLNEGVVLPSINMRTAPGGPMHVL